jgi:hypothetical protein
MGRKSGTSSSSEGSSSSQKVFGIRGFDDSLSTAIKILGLKKKRSVRELMEEAAIDLLKKYKEPF